jgi:hypothetical protein
VRPLGRGTLAEIVAVEEASPNRVRPRCRHAAACGGCAWQHVAYPEQLRRKAAALDALLRRAMGGGAPRVSPAIGMEVGKDGMPWGFRQKAAFVFGRGPEGLVMGHFARGTHDVVPVEECPVHPERANRIAFALRDALAASGIPAAGVGAEGLARHVVVRTSRTARRRSRCSWPRGRPEVGQRSAPCSRARPTDVLNLHAGRGRTSSAASRGGCWARHVGRSPGPAFLVSPTSSQTNVAAAATLVRPRSRRSR